MIEQSSSLGGTAAATFRFPGTTPESWYAAAIDAPRRVVRGAGAIVHHPLPIEWAEPTAALPDFYRAAIAGSHIVPRVELAGDRAGLLVVTVPFREAWLLVAINESSRLRQVVARRPGNASRVTFDVSPGRARLAIVDPRAWTLVDVS